jgi:hypothetical protein
MACHQFPLLRFLLGTVFVLAFMLQVFVSQAEQIGLGECPCHHLATQNDHADESHHPLPLSSSDCPCTCHVLVSLSLPTTISLSTIVISQCDYLLRDAILPDAPAQTIDYPPQLV